MGGNLSVRLVESDGAVHFEYHDGPQEILPNYCVELELMADGSLRRVREWLEESANVL